MKKLSIVLVVAFFMVGCKSYYLMENLPNVKVSTKLPALDVVLDEQSFATVTGYSTTATSTSTTGSTSPSFVGSGSNIKTTAQSTGTSTTYASEMLHNTSLIYQKNMFGIINKTGEKKGKVICRLVNWSSKSKGKLLSAAFSWMPMVFIFHLCGVPFYSAKGYMKIEVDFLDNNNNVVATYQSKGHEVKKYCAMYRGYKNSIITDVCYYEAFKECLEDVNLQVKNDYDNLNSTLLK